MQGAGWLTCGVSVLGICTEPEQPVLSGGRILRLLTLLEQKPPPLLSSLATLCGQQQASSNALDLDDPSDPGKMMHGEGFQAHELP